MRVTLSLITVALALATSLGFAIAAFAAFSISTRAEIVGKADKAVERLTFFLESPLWNLDAVGYEAIIRGELADADILAIALSDERGHSLVALERSNDVADPSRLREVAQDGIGELSREAFVSRDLPILHDGAVIGHIAVLATNRNMVANFLGRISTTIGLSLGTSIVIAVLLFFMIDRMVANRIIGLREVVAGFAEHDYAVRADTRKLDEIGELGEAFNRMAETIQDNERNLQAQVDDRTRQILDMEKFAFLGSLVAGVAHEVNTPLGVSITASSHARGLIGDIGRKYAEGSLDEEEFSRSLEGLAESLGIVSINLERAAEFIRSFKQMAVDQTVDDVRSIGVKEYIEEIILSLRPRLGKSGVKVELSLPEDLRLTCAPGALYQVFTNLIVNSLVHAFDDGQAGTISISGRGGPEAIELGYRDDGKGIAPDIVEKVFEPFFTTKRGKGGTGLGLSIVRTTIAKLGGRVSCSSELGKGVEFAITIPYLKPAPADGGAP